MEPGRGDHPRERQSRLAASACAPAVDVVHEMPAREVGTTAAGRRSKLDHVPQKSPGEAGTQPGRRSMPQLNMSGLSNGTKGRLKGR
jgi:hypothetical protein